MLLLSVAVVVAVAAVRAVREEVQVNWRTGMRADVSECMRSSRRGTHSVGVLLAERRRRRRLRRLIYERVMRTICSAF